MDPPRVLIVLGTESAWSRGTLRGFMAAAQARKWTLLHYHPSQDLDWLLREWSPAAVVMAGVPNSGSRARFESAALISVTVDLSAEGIASACIDEERVAALAAEHLREKGLKCVSTFRYDDSEFARAREQAFVLRARELELEVFGGWGDASRTAEERVERPAEIMAWLRGLPKPCGIFTCTDGWGRTVTLYAREAGLRIPEDLAVIGADNDVLECELISPPLSSVMIPWELVGREAASLVRRVLEPPRDLDPTRVEVGTRIRVAPTGVVSRRSTDILAIEDPLVAEAVSWIRQHAHQRLTVPMVAEALGGGRQRLERRFRRSLSRTIQEEIRRAHVETAKGLLANSSACLDEIAEQCGFSSASLLNSAFQREVGTPPGTYRRRARRQHGKTEDD